MRTRRSARLAGDAGGDSCDAARCWANSSSAQRRVSSRPLAQSRTTSATSTTLSRRLDGVATPPPAWPDDDAAPTAVERSAEPTAPIDEACDDVDGASRSSVTDGLAATFRATTCSSNKRSIGKIGKCASIRRQKNYEKNGQFIEHHKKGELSKIRSNTTFFR